MPMFEANIKGKQAKLTRKGLKGFESQKKSLLVLHICFIGRGQELSWFLCKGRSWHMTGARPTFLKLRHHDRRKVAFNDIDKEKYQVSLQYVSLLLSR